MSFESTALRIKSSFELCNGDSNSDTNTNSSSYKPMGINYSQRYGSAKTIDEDAYVEHNLDDDSDDDDDDEEDEEDDDDSRSANKTNMDMDAYLANSHLINTYSVLKSPERPVYDPKKAISGNIKGFFLVFSTSKIMNCDCPFQGNFVKCSSCHEIISDQFIFKVVNQCFHSKCLRCKECQSNLTDKCFIKDGIVYCKDDFFR